ncbi:hypothetical protein ANCCAN_12778 [Ancylostoma caninum]|uniref:Uncharacterized protein n=1 Tax=Ancylostoma caninum TaxID=29170 RepID=A0A368GEN4_ANCCA|nr:hypothetical protein ANCCAN_12778 [Ancylostoma caninum]
MSPEEYEHPPSSGYLKLSFNRTLFPKVVIPPGGPAPPIPLIEMQHIEDTRGFRQRSERIIEQVLDGTYEDVDVGHIEKTPDGRHDSVLIPPIVNGRRPVLYQVVSTGWGTGVILEAKDFFTVGPDRRDLHCIILDHFAINNANFLRGYDKMMVSVKDFIWIYDVKPTRQALDNPHGTLAKSRIPRTTTLENNSVYFFRASEFAFAPPDTMDEPVYGLVLSRVSRRERITHLRAVFEGAPEAVSLTPLLCDFPIANSKEDDFLLAKSRANVSSAMRFSEPPASMWARKRLCHLVRQFLPMHPDEAMTPFKVFLPSEEEKLWLEDRAHNFDNYYSDPPEAKKRMTRIFSVSCSALSAYNTMADDRRTHWITATVPSLDTFPIQIHCTLPNMPVEAGWTKRRSTMGRWYALCQASANAYGWSSNPLEEDIKARGRLMEEGYLLDICVRLTKAPAAANPIYENISRMQLFENIQSDSTASSILNHVFGRQLSFAPTGMSLS